MNLLTRFLDRPIRAVVVALVLLLLGLQAIGALNVRQYPETTAATVTITTPFIGAGAETVQGFVTSPLERGVATVEGIDYLQSASSKGASVITLQLELGVDPDDAVAQILTRIRQVSNQLPAGAENPLVTVRGSGDATSLYVAFTSEALAPQEIFDYLTRAVRPRVESVAGIEAAEVFGAGAVAMRVWLDPGRMAALGVTASEVRATLSRGSTLAALGETEDGDVSEPLDIDTNIESVGAFRRLIVREDGGRLVRLEDVADVELGAENYDSSVVVDGEPAVFIGVQVSPAANLLDAISGVRELLPSIFEGLPTGLEGRVIYDSTIAVRASIDAVIKALLQALVIVTAIIFLFLGSVRAALVPAVAMPLAVIGAFFLMQLLGYTINLLTLLALILAIGTVVDDGIVVVENASRLIDEGASADEAARTTVKDFAGSILAMNLVVIAVFAPIGLMGGLTGELFTEFAYTIAGATLISGLFALILSPMMCAQLLRSKREREEGRRRSGGRLARLASGLRAPSRWVDRSFSWTSTRYATALDKALDWRWAVLGFGALAFGSLYFLYGAAQQELEPAEDTGFLGFVTSGEPNVARSRLRAWTDELASRIGENETIEHLYVVGGNSSWGAEGGIVLKDWSERDATLMELEPRFQGAAQGVAGLDTVVYGQTTLPSTGSGPPIQFAVSSIDPPSAVLENVRGLVERANESGLFAFVDSGLKIDLSQNRLVIDRERAAALGVDIERLGEDLSTMLSGDNVGFFTYDGRSYRVVPRVAAGFREATEQLSGYRVAGTDGELVPLGSFTRVERRTEPRELERFDQLNSSLVVGVPAPGVSSGQIVDFFATEARSLSSGYVTNWAGQTRQFVEERNSLALAFSLAIVLVYLVLVAQYESFRDPLIMLASVPMSVAGALVFFALGVVSINVYTQIGLLALAGSIVRHGILLVEFANQVQVRDGLERREAMQKAASLRLRSILMTTIATVVGLIPLLVGPSGPGSVSRFAISFTLGVGMIFGTLITLFVVPALYTVMATRRASEGGEPEPARADADAGSVQPQA